MRLWTVHPKYLDCKGLVALWRETLLAKKVLEGKTKGWTKHPQLDRFKAHKFPVKAINAYLETIWEESQRRGYCFDKRKIGKAKTKIKVKVPKEFLEQELKDLKRKLKQRDKQRYRFLIKSTRMELNPVFKKI